jgi:hypothetical protein
MKGNPMPILCSPVCYGIPRTEREAPLIHSVHVYDYHQEHTRFSKILTSEERSKNSVNTLLITYLVFNVEIKKIHISAKQKTELEMNVGIS